MKNKIIYTVLMLASLYVAYRLGAGILFLYALSGDGFKEGISSFFYPIILPITIAVVIALVVRKKLTTQLQKQILWAILLVFLFYSPMISFEVRDKVDEMLAKRGNEVSMVSDEIYKDEAGRIRGIKVTYKVRSDKPLPENALDADMLSSNTSEDRRLAKAGIRLLSLGEVRDSQVIAPAPTNDQLAPSVDYLITKFYVPVEYSSDTVCISNPEVDLSTFSQTENELKLGQKETGYEVYVFFSGAKYILRTENEYNYHDFFIGARDSGLKICDPRR